MVKEAEMQIKLFECFRAAIFRFLASLGFPRISSLFLPRFIWGIATMLSTHSYACKQEFIFPLECMCQPSLCTFIVAPIITQYFKRSKVSWLWIVFFWKSSVAYTLEEGLLRLWISVFVTSVIMVCFMWCCSIFFVDNCICVLISSRGLQIALVLPSISRELCNAQTVGRLRKVNGFMPLVVALLQTSWMTGLTMRIFMT